MAVCRVLLLLCLCWPLLAQTPSAPLPAQDASAPRSPAQAAAKSSPSTAARKIPPEEQLGLDLLESALAGCRKMDAVSQGQAAWQAAKLYQQRAGGKPRAAQLLEEGFLQVLTERDNTAQNLTEARAQVEWRLLRTLIPLNVARAEELLPQAEEEARRRVLSALVSYYIDRNRDAHALELVRQMAAEQEMNYGDAIKLMERRKAGEESLVRDLFAEALNSFSGHDHKISLLPKSDDFPAMIVRFHAQLSPAIAQQAIEEVLSQAKKADADLASDGTRLNVHVASNKGEAGWTSFYDYELFALLDVLRQVDPVAAEARLKDSPTARAQMNQFANGVNDLAPALYGSPKGSNSLSVGVSIGDASEQSSTLDSDRGLEQIILAEIHEHPENALAKIPQVRKSDRRARLYADLAGAAWKAHPAAAREALRKAQVEAAHSDRQEAGSVLSDVADIYARLQDDEGAMRALESGSAVVAELYKKDTDASQPNLAPQIFWPSSVVWVRLVRSAAKLSSTRAVELLPAAPTEELRSMGQVVIAAQLLKGDFSSPAMMVFHPGGSDIDGGEDDGNGRGNHASDIQR